jgi:release factor glutamine methyltransferase
MEIYQPREDSYLLQKHVKDYCKGNVLEIGTGSGILALEAAKFADKVLAVDINPEAVAFVQKNVKQQNLKNVKVIESDLFSKVSGKFDLIIFNPPYLPDPEKDYARDIALDGGKKGYELIERFLDDVNSYLVEKGKILLLFSSLSKIKRVHEILDRNLFEFKEIDKLKIGFEELYVYVIKKNEFLKELEGKGLTDVQYFTKGNRGLLFLGNYKGKKVVVKSKNPMSEAISRIKIEKNWLKKLNKEGIGPKLCFGCDDYFVMEFVEGKLIHDLFDKGNKKEIKDVMKQLLQLMKKMDELNINKEEMHKPMKHIIIDDKNKIHLIDFERSNYSEKPKNVTQVLQFFSSGKFIHRSGLDIDKEKVMSLAKEYKKNKKIDEVLSYF